MKYLMILLFSYTAHAECVGPTINVDFNELRRGNIELNFDSELEVYLDEPIRITQIIEGKGKAFWGLRVITRNVTESDNRNFFLKWLKPRELKTYYIMKIYLYDNAKKKIQGIRDVKLQLNFQVKGKTVRVPLKILSDLSENCRP